MLWYIPIFYLVVQASIINADCSSISSRDFAKYFKSWCGIINNRRNYKSVDVPVASVIFAIHFYPWIGLCLSTFLSSHNSHIISVILLKTLWNTSVFSFISAHLGVPIALLQLVCCNFLQSLANFPFNKLFYPIAC